MSTITPFLWFDGHAEQAAEFYCSLFGGRVIDVSRLPDGRAFVVRFVLDDREYLAMNGGPGHALTDAFSLSVNAGEQERIDELWHALTADGGRESQCGWLVDRFGLSWQILPTRLPELMSGPNAAAVTEALMGMQKIIIADLEAAASRA
jgi:predicted 3-demethylubiquinone-9 3-methyltransferase (glyoxalase superfamily)